MSPTARISLGLSGIAHDRVDSSGNSSTWNISAHDKAEGASHREVRANQDPHAKEAVKTDEGFDGVVVTDELLRGWDEDFQLVPRTM
jgi:hypothetical protein